MKKVSFKDISEVNGHIFTIEQFLEDVKAGALTDYDGWGALATEIKVSDWWVRPSDFVHGECFPGELAHKKVRVPKWATHVVWYNR